MSNTAVFFQQTEEDGEDFWEETSVFVLQLSKKDLFDVIIHFTGKALQPRLPSSHRH